MKQPTDPAGATATLAPIPVDRIRPDPKNRKNFAHDEIVSLAESIKAEGLLQPIVVRRVGPLENPGDLSAFQIIAGERRWLAHKHLKLSTIEARVLDIPAADVAATVTKRAVENLQRVDLTPIETAQVYQELLDTGKSHAEVAKIAGRSQPDVSNTLRLLQLPADVKTLIDEGELTRAHGVALARFAKWPKACEAIAAAAVAARAPAKVLETGVPFYWQPQVSKHVARHYFGKIPAELKKDPDFFCDDAGWVACFVPARLIQFVNRVQEQEARKARPASDSKQLDAHQQKARDELAAARARNHQRRGELAMQFERALQDLRRSKICDALMLAVLASEAVKGGYVANRIREVADKLGIKCNPGVIPSGGGNGLGSVDAMAKMDPCDVAKLAVGVILSKETDDALRNPSGYVPVNLNRYADPKAGEKEAAGRILRFKAEAEKILASGGGEADIQNKLGCTSVLAADLYKLASIKRSEKARVEKLNKLDTMSKRLGSLSRDVRVAKAKKRGARAVITDETRAQVKRMVYEGRTGGEIAKRIGISLPSVQNIKKALGLVRR